MTTPVTTTPSTVGQNPTGRPRKSSAGTRRKKAKQLAAQAAQGGGR